MQIPDEFAPQSWEMPPGARVLEESASVVTRDVLGETQQWFTVAVQLPFIEDPIVWIKRADIGSDAGFVVYDDSHHYHAPFTARKNAKILDWVFSQGNYHRQFVLNARGELRREGEAAHECLQVDCVGNGSWSLGAIRAERHGLSGFRWDVLMTPVAFRRLSALDAWRIISELLVDPTSDAAFARRFALLDEEERHLLVFGRPRIDKAEIASLLRALIIDSIRWQGSALEGEVFFSLRADGEYTLYFRSEQKGGRDPLPNQVHENVKRVRARFLSGDKSRNEEVPKYGCVSSWMDSMKNVAEIVISSPTAHQQLEAHLLWRDWLASIEVEED